MAEEKSSAWYYYNCEHGASNDPCLRCFPKAEAVPDDWQETYEAPEPTGITDSTNLSG